MAEYLADGAAGISDHERGRTGLSTAFRGEGSWTGLDYEIPLNAPSVNSGRPENAARIKSLETASATATRVEFTQREVEAPSHVICSHFSVAARFEVGSDEP